MKAFHWQCHICGEVRRDEFISVHTKPLEFGDGVVAEQNVRYCNDKYICTAAAPHFDFISKPEDVKLIGLEKRVKKNDHDSS